ncbi:MAG: penicillin acylase family protein [Burkholderiaceae bacterium]
MLATSFGMVASTAVHARGASNGAPGSATRAIEIRRTTDGIPHIRADDWRGLGVGVGFAQAQDALCTLAEAFVTYEGKRSLFFGADQRPALDSSMGRAKNIDSDFFFSAFADASTVARFRAEQPAELIALAEGYADGYNRRLREIRAHPSRGAGRGCLNARWLRPIVPQDVFRRMYAVQLMAGYLQFLPDIVNAAPGAARESDAADTNALRTRLANNLGVHAELGSNAIAWGRQATGGDGAVLLGNPHWFWGGPDRFYQMQLTIPGQLNVAGVGFLGVPLVMIGFNEHVAWSHTVSSARRFGLFQLALDPADAHRYLVDGVAEPMQARRVTVDVAQGRGRVRRVTRTLYTSRFGPIVDLAHLHPALGWSDARAIAVRDVNADNWRSYRNFLEWGRAGSLDEFVAIQRREAAMPWVNTVAIGKGDGRVWYADIGAVPDVPDDFRKACAAPLAQAFAQFDSRTPFLDGSRSHCTWRIDADAAQAGAMPAGRLPGLLRDDYVANMNDSHWLANIYQPLEGFPELLGEEKSALRIRGRLGHQIAIALLEEGARSSAALSRSVMRDALASRVYSAEQFKQTLLDQACPRASGRGADDAEEARACDILRAWGNTGEVDDRGALLWDAFWQELQKVAQDKLYKIPFSTQAPLTTPSAPALDERGAAKALAAAIASLSANGIALDAAPGSQRVVFSGGRRWPVYGGCGDIGYFTTACPEEGGYRMGPNVISNSYLQVVRFGDDGVDAHTLLAHGEDERAVSGGPGSAPVARYSRKDWLPFPFREADIRRDPQLTRTVLQR